MKTLEEKAEEYAKNSGVFYSEARENIKLDFIAGYNMRGEECQTEIEHLKDSLCKLEANLKFSGAITPFHKQIFDKAFTKTTTI